MSRSYRKVPGHKDHNTWFKKYHRRKFRRYANNLNNEIKSNSKPYVKFCDVWDWCDWKFLYYTKEELTKSRELWKETCIERGWSLDDDPLHRYYMK